MQNTQISPSHPIPKAFHYIKYESEIRCKVQSLNLSIPKTLQAQVFSRTVRHSDNSLYQSSSSFSSSYLSLSRQACPQTEPHPSLHQDYGRSPSKLGKFSVSLASLPITHLHLLFLPSLDFSTKIAFLYHDLPSNSRSILTLNLMATLLAFLIWTPFTRTRASFESPLTTRLTRRNSLE